MVAGAGISLPWLLQTQRVHTHKYSLGYSSPFIWPNGFLRRQGNSQGSGYAPIDFLLFTDTSQGHWSCPDDFFSSVLPGYRKMFLADWLFRRSCASFQLVFCDVPHVDVFLMCLLGEGELHILLPLHLNPPPASLHTGLLSIAELSKPFPPAHCHFSSLCILCSFSGSSHD